MSDFADSEWSTSVYLYESPRAKRAIDLTSIEGDLEEALLALETIDATKNSAEDILVNRALWNYALTLYARLFTKGSRRSPGRPLNNVIRVWPAGRDVHEHVLGVRHKHVAHVLSDMERWGTALEMGERPDGSYRMRAMGVVLSVSGPVTDPIAADFHRLVEALLAQVRDAAKAAWEAVNAEVRDKGMTPADIAQLPAAPPLPGAGPNSWRSHRR